MKYKWTLNKITGISLVLVFMISGSILVNAQKTARDAHKRAKKIAAQKNGDFRSLYAGKLAEYKQLKSLLGQEDEIADLLLNLQEIARQNELTILRFSTRKTSPQDFINSKTVEVEVETNFINLLDFFGEAAKSQKIVSIDGFKINQRQIQSSDKTLNAKFLLTVYYGANNSFEEKQSSNLKPVEELKVLEAKITNLDAMMATIKSLRVAQVAPSAVLEALRERIVMSLGLYLESVEQTGEQIIIEGSSPDETTVAQFGRSLEFSGGLLAYLDIETKRQKLIPQNNAVETVKFTIRSQYNPSKAVSPASN